MCVLKAWELGFKYPTGETVLDKLSFDLDAGEATLLVGPNGCGKSTLLRILNGLLFPSSGEYRVHGEVVTEAKLNDSSFNYWFRRRVAFVFQNSDAQLFSPTVRDEIAFGPLHLGISKGEVLQRVSDCAHLLGIEHLMDRSPMRLSEGQKKAVAIASVLSANPSIILLDEPLAGLDDATANRLIGLLAQLKASGKTLLIAAHDIENYAPLRASRLCLSASLQ